MKILIIGGNRFFGKRLASKLAQKHDLYLLNRGNLDDSLGDGVKRILCDRNDTALFEKVMELHSHWDIVFDHCCYQAREAREVCRILGGKIKKYIFISSQSVYGEGKNILEEDFDPKAFSFDREADRYKDYAEAKRQAEAIFSNEATFPVVAVRFPIVMGDDDYTGRLLFHINRIKKNEPIFFPNLNARISFIDSEDAANALARIVDLKFEGPVNIASPTEIALKDLVRIIEESVGNKIIIATEATEDNHSPYGIREDWFMNTKKAKHLGLSTRNLSDWLPELIIRMSN